MLGTREKAGKVLLVWDACKSSLDFFLFVLGKFAQVSKEPHLYFRKLKLALQ